MKYVMKYIIPATLFTLACLAIIHIRKNQSIQVAVATNNPYASIKRINIKGPSIELYNLLLSFRSLDYTPQESDWQKARTLIEAGAEVNLQTPHSLIVSHPLMTLLHFAVIHNNQQMVAYLLAHGAHVNSIDMGGETPLHYAARYKRHEIAKLLLDNGADRTIQDDVGYTPLDFAQKKDYALDQTMADILQHYPHTAY